MKTNCGIIKWLKLVYLCSSDNVCKELRHLDHQTENQHEKKIVQIANRQHFSRTNIDFCFPKQKHFSL